MGKLEGKTALITGASRGIGRGIAVRLAGEGARVIVNYANDRAAAEAAAREIAAAGGQAIIVQADVSDMAQIEGMFEEIRSQVEAIDILVNNAGRSAPGFPQLDAVTEAAYDACFDLNAKGTFFVTQKAVAMMPDGGRVINISSMAARIHQAGLAVYSASKAAGDAFVRIWATELGPRRITVNSLNVGITETDMTAGLGDEMRARLIAQIPMGRIGQVPDIADAAAFFASDDSRWISGENIAVSGARFT
ncbi:MAG: putative short-chain type dehydrogenase/reductase [Phenylobacterium sp.]|nr:putative short-chain type dehydrogenase/reductase [Phenylobacterium sp.]